jgi:hypothetical protein
MTSQINYLIAQQRVVELHQAADRSRLASTRPARRRVVAILAVTAALAAAASPTQARTFGLNAHGSMVPSVSTPAGRTAAQRPGPCSEVCSGHGYDLERATSPAILRTVVHSNDPEWAYVTVGAGAAGLMLLGIGGTVTLRRARRENAQQPTIAA